ncbi:MAG: tetratricopeptide repeat protein [Zavarzinia sp.]|nr:tetratricopeptide repeat protein [Zavarzinia sp.]
MSEAGVNEFRHLAGSLNLLLRRGDWARALDTIDRMIVLQPGSAALHYNRGLVLKRLGRTGESVDAFGAALERDQGHAHARFELAASLLDAGQLAPAAVEFARYLDLEPEDADAHLNLGDALLRLGRQDEALPHLRLAHDAAPTPRAEQSLALALRDTGDLDGCIALTASWPADEPAAAAARLKILTQGSKGQLRLDPAQFPPARNRLR